MVPPTARTNQPDGVVTGASSPTAPAAIIESAAIVALKYFVVIPSTLRRHGGGRCSLVNSSKSRFDSLRLYRWATVPTA